ncbi:MAG: DUF4212 domain-containing protein [Saprospiraceae bacterium]
MEKKKYWQTKIKYLLILLSLWFTVSILCSIVFVHQLNGIKLGGFPLGFWFAMQGSMIVFVLLIFVYVHLMNRLDKAFKAKN